MWFSTQFTFWWFVLMLFATSLHADSWPPPSTKTYESQNGKYVFRVTPNWGEKPPQIGTCRGQLYRRENDELEIQWERPLINNIAPIRAYVADSGEYVVTIGEWGNFEEFPVVFYEHHGFLVNVHGRTDQIAPRLVIGRAIMSGGHWLANSLFLFGPDDASFIIRLNTGDLVLFETDDGELINKKWKTKWRSFPHQMKLYDELHAQVGTLILYEALRLKSSDRPRDREKGQFILNQQTDAESAAILRQIAEQDQTVRIIESSGEKKDVEYPIRQAARQALEKLGQQVPSAASRK